MIHLLQSDTLVANLPLYRDVDFEMIIVDDGSPDGTQDVVKKLQEVYGEDHIVSVTKTYPFISVINDFVYS